jgi:high-affinity iron transporter
LLLVLIVGGGLLGAFYGLAKNAISSIQEIWEGTFAIVASIIITIMGAALLRINKMREKWRAKLTALLDQKTMRSSLPVGEKFKLWWEKYILVILPFITVVREGLEAIAFIGGVGLGYPATAFPIPVITGLLAGAAIGFLIYKYEHIYRH